jgi:hypothetical protein
MKIFDHLKIPVLMENAEARRHVELLVNDDLAFPDLSRLPAPIGNGKASGLLKELLSGG